MSYLAIAINIAGNALLVKAILHATHVSAVLHLSLLRQASQ
jgi:hypothetical protein